MDTATLIAAIVAAIAAIGAALVSALMKRESDARDSVRASLVESLVDLGDALHQVVALATEIPKRKALDAVRKKHEEASQQAERLKTLRRRLRYPLWDCHDGINKLSRLPDWVMHCRKRDVACDRLIAAATDLREAIDRAVLQVWDRGQRPDSASCEGVQRAAAQLTAVWDSLGQEKSIADSVQG